MIEKFDAIDWRILRALQRDASRTVAELAAEVGLSANPCWRRIRRLEAAGIVRKRVALLDAGALSLGLTVFVSIKTSQHAADWLAAFTAAVRNIPEIVEIHRMSGDVDYLLKIIARDIADYDRIYKRMIGAVELSEVTARFSMERIKETTELPLPAA